MNRWMVPLLVLMCACVRGPSSTVYGVGPSQGLLAQSMDSASSACRQNPAYCTAVAGEETVLPIPVSTTPSPVPPETAAPAKDEGSEGSKDKTTELSWQEFKKICYEKYTGCLETAVQGIDGPLYKHSQCVACRDLCMQKKGAWPSEANGMPCP